MLATMVIKNNFLFFFFLVILLQDREVNNYNTVR